MKLPFNFSFNSSNEEAGASNTAIAKGWTEIQKRHFPAFLDSVKPENKVGLEIGPLDRPFIDKNKYQVLYLDYFDEEQLQKSIRNTPGRDPNNIVKLDYILSGANLSDVVDKKFDYIFSSHVLEHVPNLFGYLSELHKLLNESGMLFAIIPDCRYCFDIERPETSLGELIENFHFNRDKPSMKHVFDQWFYHKKVNPLGLWGNYEKHKKSLSRTFSLEQSYNRSKKAEHCYIDCHVNLFTPTSFQECIEASRKLGLHQFDLIKTIPTKKNTLDFSVLLKARTNEE